MTEQKPTDGEVTPPAGAVTWEVYHADKIVTKQSSVLTQQSFDELASSWKRECAGVSAMSRILSNEHYLKVIRYGWAAVPFILRDLKKQAAPWFTALRVITDESDIGAQHRGNFRQIANA